MIRYNEFFENFSLLKMRVSEAVAAVGRNPGEIGVLPVTKTHPVEAAEFARRAGLTAVGENRVQEAAGKRAEAPDLDLDWELIGHLQSNKAAQALKIFDRIQSVDSLKLAQRLNRMAGDERCRLRCLLQVNTGEDPRKFGFGVADFEREFEELLPLEHLLIEGLMTIAPVEDGSGVARRAFARLRELAEEARVRSGLSLPELSMGMSGDLAEAIAEGSTLIRVGSALYGERG